MDNLIAFDQQLFLFFNGFHTSWLDAIMVHISGKLEWIPFYALMAFLAYQKLGLKGLIALLVLALLVVLLNDRLSVMAFKNVFERLRPCHEPVLDGLVHIVNDRCGGQFGFVSSHAANIMGLAVLFVRFFETWKWHWKMGIILWAVLVGYSRIYLGVHYPGDVLGGFLLGFAIVSLLFWVLNRFNLKRHYQ
ncbi:MAG: undecaprenyl-diphosphatase [Flavobacteriales bacterium]|jgi:undecaprenyl-diphosphatase